MGLCQFCSKGKAEFPIVDSETQQEVWICESCNNWLGLDEDNKPKGYTDITFQALQKGIDEVVDNQIEQDKLKE